MNKLKSLCILTAITLMVGCTAPLGYVQFSVACKDQVGKLGNDCKIVVPDNSQVTIDGDNIKVNYTKEESNTVW
jgi:ABC-type uncharacterized transport system auxiliary subunit